MTGSILRAAAVIVLVVGQGCVRIGRGGPPQLLTGKRTSTQTTRSSDERLSDGFGPKSVHGKQAPLSLIARDGTSCTVSKRKFESTRLGTSVWCFWGEGTR